MIRFGLFLSLLASLAAVQAFAPVQPSAVARTTNPPTISTTRLNELPAAVDQARISFFIWFFGASGGAGIARSAFPRMYNSVRYIQGLKGSPSAGGETIGLSPLCGYPEDLSVADIQKIVNNKLSIEQIVKKFPIEGNFLTEIGYLSFDAFEKANKDCNPLVVRAVFDTFNTSTDIVAPDQAQALIDEYKANPSALAGKLLKAKLIGFSSYSDWRTWWHSDMPKMVGSPNGLVWKTFLGLYSIPTRVSQIFHPTGLVMIIN